MNKIELNDSVMTVKNVGEERLKKLHSLNIYKVKDLILHFPRDYEDRTRIKKIIELTIDEINTIKCKISKTAENMNINNMKLTKLTIKDDSDTLEIIWFNRHYLKNFFKTGEEYYFTGKVVSKFGKIQMESPEFEKIEKKDLLLSGRIVPIYATTYKLSQNILRGLIFTTLELVKGQFEEFLPDWIIEKYNLIGRNSSIENIHFPKDDELFFRARKRLVFDEFFLMQLTLLKIKGLIKNETSISFENLETTELIKRLPFSLTNAQKKVLCESINELSEGLVINRLIQGDVGSGKTAVAMVLAYIAIHNGYKAALMVPTEVLANQHFISFKNIFDQLGIETVRLTGSLKKKEKDTAHSVINSEKPCMIIGTHAIIQEKITINRLALVITDEQHRFGVRQRAVFAEKGMVPHVLVMSATPIPRTLALVLYGDLDISIIDELPPGRQKIDTYSVTTAYRKRIYAFIQKEIDCGRQVYMICPMIEEKEDEGETEVKEKKSLEDVVSYTEKLKEIFIHHRVEFLHGKMKQDAKQAIMDDFMEGKIAIIVATTVIEVGINVPNATVMVVENAERFGLSQLHQLRGRVGRGSDKSYCILITDGKSEVTKKRMKAMSNTNDGFEISSLDLEIRGSGDFFGTRQHGLPEMKIANIYKDMDILKQAQSAAQELILMDPNLDKQENKLVLDEMNQFLVQETFTI